MQLPRIDMARDALPVLLPVLLVAAWLGGGVTADPTGTDEWLQLLALPVLLVALAALQAHQLAEPLPRMALAAAALVVLVPALQLLPIPSAWWHASTPRQLLAADLQLAGIPAPGSALSTMVWLPISPPLTVIGRLFSRRMLSMPLTLRLNVRVWSPVFMIFSS